MTYDVDGFMIGYTGGKSPCYAGGFTVVDENNVLVVRHVFRTYPKRWTNNDGELWAVAAGIHQAAPGDIVRSDSEVVVKWWLPRGLCKSRPDLDNLCKTAYDERRVKDIDVIWVPRKENLAGIYNEQNRLT